MTQTTQSVLGVVALFGVLPLLLLWLRDRVNHARHRHNHPPEKIAADRKAYEGRLLRPDWVFYERHLQRPAPMALRELYADHDLITTAQVLKYSNDDRINSFGALDEQELIDSRPVTDFEMGAIATTDFGDPIYLRPGPAEPDTVYITHHDGGDTEVFAESVAMFYEQLKESNGGEK